MSPPSAKFYHVWYGADAVAYSPCWKGAWPAQPAWGCSVDKTWGSLSVSTCLRFRLVDACMPVFEVVLNIVAYKEHLPESGAIESALRLRNDSIHCIINVRRRDYIPTAEKRHWLRLTNIPAQPVQRKFRGSWEKTWVRTLKGYLEITRPSLWTTNRQIRTVKALCESLWWARAGPPSLVYIRPWRGRLNWCCRLNRPGKMSAQIIFFVCFLKWISKNLVRYRPVCAVSVLSLREHGICKMSLRHLGCGLWAV